MSFFFTYLTIIEVFFMYLDVSVFISTINNAASLNGFLEQTETYLVTHLSLLVNGPGEDVRAWEAAGGVTCSSCGEPPEPPPPPSSCDTGLAAGSEFRWRPAE